MLNRQGKDTSHLGVLLFGFFFFFFLCRERAAAPNTKHPGFLRALKRIRAYFFFSPSCHDPFGIVFYVPRA